MNDQTNGQPVYVAPAPQQPASTPPPSPNGLNIVPPTPKKEFPKIIIWAGIAVLIGILGFVVFKLFSGKSTTQSSEITWWGLWEDSATVATLISEYETAHPKVKINYVKQSPADYRERLTNALAKGNGPDIFRFHNTWVPMLKNELDTLPSSVMNSSDFSKTFYPIALSDLTTSKGIVGLPVEYDALTLYINEDIFNKAGKSPPTTWDELRSLARELTVKDDRGVITQSGVALGRTENVDHWQEILALLMLQNNVDLSDPASCSSIKDSEGKETGQVCLGADALKFFSAFSMIDGVWDATLPSSTQAFAAGKLAMYLAPSWRSFEISLSNPDLKFKTVPVPQPAKDIPTQKDISYATYWVEGVWARSTGKAAAWDFLKFITTKESLQKLYSSSSKVRTFGEPYSRVDMASVLSNHPILGSIINLAPGAKSWYLASRTFDGPTGINSLLSKYFEDAVNSVNGGGDPQDALDTAGEGVKQVLTQYGLSSK